MIVVPDSACCAQLDALLDAVTLYCHLFVNDVELDRATALEDLVEPDWDDYAAQKIGTWTPAVIEIDRATAYADPLEWTRGTGGTADQVYGYFVTVGPSGPLWWGERVCGRYSLEMSSAEDVAVVWPRYQGQEIPGVPCAFGGGVVVGGE